MTSILSYQRVTFSNTSHIYNDFKVKRTTEILGNSEVEKKVDVVSAEIENNDKGVYI